MFKNYYIYKGKRYGVRNEVETPFGHQPILLWNMLKGVFLSFWSWLLLECVAWITNLEFFGALGLLVCVAISVYVYYLFICFNRCIGGKKNRTCFYCAPSIEEVEQHIEAVSEKNPDYRDLCDVIADDGWYMLFLKGE